VQFRTISGEDQNHVVSQAGEGPDVVLLHGFPDTPPSWAELETALVAAGWRVTVPWLRGYHPDTIVAGRPYDAETLGRDALALLDAIDAREAVLVGHDWGALIAYSAAAQAPERVRAIVPIAIPHPSVLKRTPASLWAVRHFFALKLPRAADRVRRHDFAYLDELYTRWAPDWSGPERDASLERAKQAFASPQVLEGALDYYRAILFADGVLGLIQSKNNLALAVDRRFRAVLRDPRICEWNRRHEWHSFYPTVACIHPESKSAAGVPHHPAWFRVALPRALHAFLGAWRACSRFECRSRYALA